MPAQPVKLSATAIGMVRSTSEDVRIWGSQERWVSGGSCYMEVPGRDLVRKGVGTARSRPVTMQPNVALHKDFPSAVSTGG